MSMISLKWGDTLSGLAKKFGTSVDALAKKNNIKNPDLIYAGNTLLIPGKGFSGQSSYGASGSQGAASRLEGRSGTGGASGPSAAGAVGPARGDTNGISLQELKQIMPTLDDGKAQQYLPYLNSAMNEAKITTPERRAAFLAQLAHESGQLKYMEEIASGSAYEGRSDLGNTQPGDGTRFKGRGPIQLTGRANYAEASKALGVDLVNNPERAADPDVAFRIATWYWETRDLNQYADKGDFSSITYRINGGYNGAADRNQYWASAKDALYA